MTAQPDTVVGRADELADLDALCDADPAAGAAAVILVGEAGIGKSTLWRHGIDTAHARGLRLLVARAVESEGDLAFVSLGDLLEPVADELLATLPRPQAHALAVALLRESGSEDAVDRLAVQRAFTGGLRLLAATGPVVVALDDIQWMDGPTTAALAFAVRRLQDVPVRILATLRRPHPDPLDLYDALGDRLRQIEVGPLALADLHAVIEDRLSVSVPPATMRRIHETTHGNPFYAVEIARTLPTVDGRVAAGRLNIPASLVELVEDRLRSLSPRALAVVAAAGALAEPTTGELRGLGGDAEDGLSEAEDAGILIREDGAIRFAHPLLASASMAVLSPSARLALHQRLARIAASDLERALHGALGTTEPSEQVAAEAEAAASVAAERGAPHTAGELATHAARLTRPDDVDARQRRQLAGASHFVTAGELSRGRPLLEELEQALPPGPRRAEVKMLLADTDSDLDRARERCEAACAEAQGDPAGLAEAHRLTSEFTMLHGRIAEALDRARRATAIARTVNDPVLLVRCLGTQSHYETYRGEITPGLLEDAVALEAATPRAGNHYSPAQIMGLRLMYADRLDEGRELLDLILARTEANGDDLERANLLQHLAQLEIRAGRWARARAIAAESAAHERQLGVQSDSTRFLEALVAAHVGHEQDCRAAATCALDMSDTQMHPLWRLMTRWAMGLLELSLANADAAARHLAPLPELLHGWGYRNPGVRPILPDCIEALVGVGRPDEAEPWAAALEDAGLRLGNHWALATGLRGRGQIAAARGDLDGALELFARADTAHERSSTPFEHARTRMWAGIVQRRARHWKAARETLGAALDGFETLGAGLWAERTVSELARIQGRRSASGLSATERRVAELVAAGRSNREAAAALTVSVRAIEANLSRIYAKLGIRSRTELVARMAREQ